MKRLLIASIALTVACSAQAQSVRQSGTVTMGQPAIWTAQGVISSGGLATAGKLTGVGVTAGGNGICQSSASAPAAYNILCLGVTGTSGTITLSNIGGATGNLTLKNGSSTFQLPANNGTNGYILTTNGAGITLWAAAGVGTGTVTQVNTGTYATGGPITSIGTVSVPFLAPFVAANYGAL